MDLSKNRAAWRRRRSASAFAVTLAAAAVLTGCTGVPSEALSKLAHLDAGAHPAADLEPPIVDGVDSDLVTSSLRLLHTTDGTQFWVGVTEDDRVCFIAAGESNDTSCVGADRFGRAGATLYLDDPERRVWLHLEYMTVGPGWTKLTPSIAVRTDPSVFGQSTGSVAAS